MDTDPEAPLVKDVLTLMDLGSSVAEHDELLGRYFIETATFRSVIEGRVDVVAGDKGTGKTALFRILKERYTEYDELRDVEVVAAFNPVGTPVFQRLLETDELSEDQYIGVWKAYFCALAGNWLLAFSEGYYTDTLNELDQMLTDVGLRSADDSPQTIFSQLVNRLKSLLRLKSIEQTMTFDQATGMPVLATTKFVIGDSDHGAEEVVKSVRHDDALRLLNAALAESDIKLWLVMDRLDEAFQGRPAQERPALRALLRTYLDMLEFTQVRLKLFVRRDLFARVVEGGFVNLTHINARRVDIVWEEDDLYNLLMQRIRESARFMNLFGDKDLPSNDIFARLFPNQVDQGARKPKTWTWMLSRIRDGNGVHPPRNLIDLILKSKEAQLRIEERTPRRVEPSEPVLTSDSLKRGLKSLSAERVQGTLLAEAGDYADLVERFRNGKAEFDYASLRSVLIEDFDESLKLLRTIGFLEASGPNYKVPMLYRAGLSITQGKASQSESDPSSPGSTDDEE